MNLRIKQIFFGGGVDNSNYNGIMYCLNVLADSRRRVASTADVRLDRTGLNDKRRHTRGVHRRVVVVALEQIFED